MGETLKQNPMNNLNETLFLKWDAIKENLSIYELLSLAVATHHSPWDEEMKIATDCIERCFLKIDTMTPSQKSWLGSVCIAIDDVNGIKKVWENMAIDTQAGADRELLVFTKEIKESNCREKLKEVIGNLNYPAVNFFENQANVDVDALGEFLKNLSRNEITISHDRLCRLFKKYTTAVSDPEKLASFLLNSNRPVMKELGVLDDLLVKLFSFGKGPYRMIYEAFESEKVYPYAVEWLLGQAPKITETVRVTEFWGYLEKLQEEDRKKVEAATPPAFLKAVYLLKEFEKLYKSQIVV